VPAGEAASFALGKGKKLYLGFQERLKTLNAADFGDLLLENIRLFREQPDVLRQYQQRFKYVLVDEYQDTNVAQYLWLRLLAQRVSGPTSQPVIPGRREAPGPESITTDGEYGFRARASGAPRNDEEQVTSPPSPYDGFPSPLEGEGGELRAHASDEPGEGLSLEDS